MSLVEISNVSKSYFVDGREHCVLDNISFSIEEGEILCVVGNTGCGKTTLLRIIEGYEKPTNGQVNCDKDCKVIVSTVYQELNQLFPWKRLIDNVVFPIISMNSTKRQDAVSIARRLLKEVGLEEYANYYPYQLSGGMRQRGAIARALVVHPDLLLLDEPFSSLDEVTRSLLQDLLLRLHQEKDFSAFFITHSIGEALYIADRIAIMCAEEKGIVTVMNNPFKKNKKRNKQYFELMNNIRDTMGKVTYD